MGKSKKKNPSFKKKLLAFFTSHPEQDFNYKQVAAALNIRDTKSRNALIKQMNLDAASGILTSSKPGKFRYVPAQQQVYTGRLEVTSSGRGFVICEDLEDDIRIVQKNIAPAFDGDIVDVETINKKRNGTLEGRIINVVERKKIRFVGQLQIDRNHAFVLTRGGRNYTDFYIDKTQLTADYSSGDKVLVELKDWPKNASSPFGILIENLGTPGDTSTEMHAILTDYGLPLRFPKEVEAAAKKIDHEITAEEIKKRRDFRSTLTFTIDPKTAKDFDDALSFKKLSEDRFEVGIHIADVSHYVRPHSVLDEEAIERATSVYLVDRVVPMLPEVLSNGVCSLRPHEEKYTFSAVFELDSKGNILKEWFGKTVIYSDHRFAYEEVQEVIETNQPIVGAATSLTGNEYTIDDAVFEAIVCLNKIAKNIRHDRMQAGAISFDRVEVNFHLDANDQPEGVYFKTSKDANKLIEEFMLMANRQVARFAGQRSAPLPMVYRVHDEPDPDKLFNLQSVVAGFGYQLNLKTKNISHSINQLLLKSQGTQEQNMIDTLAIRCMSKAEYTTHNIGHYGLAFDHYTHFTSPIRRYPDIMVHRLLEQHLKQQKVGGIERLEEQCHYASQREQLATKAERDSVKFMQIKFMEGQVGKQFVGVISGVTDRGIYVELLANKCEGMIRIKDIPGDYYHYDQRNHCLIGERTKQVLQLGDQVNIEVKSADLLKRHLDFLLVSD